MSHTPSNPRGYVVYEGPSMLDGSPIVAIVTMHSDNAKTGDMSQLWILRADRSPVQAVKDGSDAGICGDCRHRGSDGFKGRTCYVHVGQGPRAVYAAWINGAYMDVTAEGRWFPVQHGRRVRLGAYGDPAALPENVVRAVVECFDGHTGYSHQWRAFPWLRPYVMASVDSETEALAARAAGWRYFRVTAPDAAPLARESLCPSESVGIQCQQCRACDGTANLRSGSIRITVHGIGSKRFTEATVSGMLAHSSR